MNWPSSEELMKKYEEVIFKGMTEAQVLLFKTFKTEKIAEEMDPRTVGRMQGFRQAVEWLKPIVLGDSPRTAKSE